MKACYKHEWVGASASCEECAKRNNLEQDADGFWVTSLDKGQTRKVMILMRKTQPYDHHDARPIEVEVINATRDLEEVAKWEAQNVGYTGWVYFAKPLFVDANLLKE